MRTVGLAIGAALLANAGCESCDWSFGPIPILVTVSPEVPARVTVCAEDQSCETIDTGVDTGMSGEPGAAEFFIGWHGYTQCRQPALEILVVADGCTPKTCLVERQKHSDTSGLIDVTLDCG